MRLVEPGHKLWLPRDYQDAGVDWLCGHGSAFIWLRPGRGKTAITLEAFRELQEQNIAQKMLVIAPKRVCQLVWRQEAAKWTQFRHFEFCLLAGVEERERKRLLNTDADIYLINPENVPWLCGQFRGAHRLPFDTITIDEITKFKNSGAERSKKLQKFSDASPRIWGLTGTPAPNGYMDLFGQMKQLDGGAALGRYISHYRDRYFLVGRDGFSYDLKPGGKERIEDALRPYVFNPVVVVKEPTITANPIMIEMKPPALKLYKEMKKEMIAQMDGQPIVAQNAAGLYSKLKQMANGAVYTAHPAWTLIHDEKLDALEELVEELAGEPLMVGYEFQHDLERILKRFPKTRYIGAGTSDAEAQAIERDWNAGKITMLPCHPASVGHGLNMQLGGASNFCWFSETIDAELWDQLLRRIARSGNAADEVMMHQLIVRGTIDEQRVTQVKGKIALQNAMLAAVSSEFYEGDDMRKLGEAAGAPQEQTRAPTPPAPATDKPKAGWGRKDDPAAAAQKTAIDDKLTAPQIRTSPEDRVEEPTGFNAETDAALADANKAPPSGWDKQKAVADKAPPKPRATKAEAPPAPAHEPVQFGPTSYPPSVHLNIDVAALVLAFHTAGSSEPDMDASDMIAGLLALVRNGE